MDNQPNNTDDSDVEGHAPRLSNGADSESAEGDTAGHRLSGADADSAEDDDVSGHVYIQERDDLNGQRIR